MQDFIASVTAIEREFGLPLLTPEMQVLAYLLANGPTPSLFLQGRIRISPAGFHMVRRRLKERQIIEAIPSADDLRVMLYDLVPKVRAALLERFVTAE